MLVRVLRRGHLRVPSTQNQIARKRCPSKSRERGGAGLILVCHLLAQRRAVDAKVFGGSGEVAFVP